MAELATIPEGLHTVSLSDILPSKNNTRQINRKSPDIQELAVSIREKGLLQPPLVRPHPEKKGKWELCAGHRRWTAAQIAGLATIPVIVRHLDDQEALEATVCENLQREDLAVLEQAEGVQKLLGGGYSVEAAAKSLGKSATWVYARAQITKLSEKWKQAISQTKAERYGPQFPKWSVAHLELIAQLAPEAQEKILKTYESRYHVPDLKDLRDEVADLTRSLGKAPFDIADAGLVVKAGPCTACPKRQGANPGLFGVVDGLPAEKDTCQDGLCYQKKVQAHIRRKVKEEKAKDPNLLEVRHRQWYWDAKRGKTYYENRAGTYVRCKKGEKGALPAVVVKGTGEGRKVFVKLEKKTERRQGEGPKTVGKLREELERDRTRTALNTMEEAIQALTLEDLKGQLTAPTDWLQVIAAVGGADEPWHIRQEGHLGDRLQLYREDSGALMMRIWNLLQEEICSRIPHSIDKEDAPYLCQVLGLDWAGFVIAAKEAHPEPPEWAGLKDGDVPGKKKAKKTRKAKKAAKTPESEREKGGASNG